MSRHFQYRYRVISNTNPSFSGKQFKYRYLTECYDELGTQYKVPIYCLSYPINIVKEDNGRDSPDDYSEAVDGGPEISLKIRMSSSFSDTKLTVYSKDTISQCKKKLQVRIEFHSCCLYRTWKPGGNCIFLMCANFWAIFDFRRKKTWTRVVNVGSIPVNYWATKFKSKMHIFNQVNFTCEIW